MCHGTESPKPSIDYPKMYCCELFISHQKALNIQTFVLLKNANRNCWNFCRMIHLFVCVAILMVELRPVSTSFTHRAKRSSLSRRLVGSDGYALWCSNIVKYTQHAKQRNRSPHYDNE